MTTRHDTCQRANKYEYTKRQAQLAAGICSSSWGRLLAGLETLDDSPQRRREQANCLNGGTDIGRF